MPRLPATNSPTMAPTSAKEIATFMPANRLGNAQGKRILVSTDHGEAFETCARCSISGSTERKPSTMSITIGKIASISAIATFGSGPVPIQITNSGASATFGNRIERDQQRIDRAFQKPRIDDADRERDAEHHGERKADAGHAQREAEIAHEQAGRFEEGRRKSPKAPAGSAATDGISARRFPTATAPPPAPR